MTLCVQEHYYIHEEVQIKEHGPVKHWTIMTSSAWKINANVSIGRIAMLLSPHAYKALNSIEGIIPIILLATFNGNSHATIICSYSPTNEVETETFYDELSSITRQIPKYNV